VVAPHERTFDVMPDSLHICENCGDTMHGWELHPICDLSQRLDPGSEVPSGQCPHCQALTYKYDIVQKYVRHLGTRCPFCQSQDIQAQPLSGDAVEHGRFTQDVVCLRCKCKWTDVYKLAEFEVQG
jgi:hypothetical protein